MMLAELRGPIGAIVPEIAFALHRHLMQQGLYIFLQVKSIHQANKRNIHSIGFP